jgi:hypothetical protein
MKQFSLPCSLQPTALLIAAKKRWSSPLASGTVGMVAGLALDFAAGHALAVSLCLTPNEGLWDFTVRHANYMLQALPLMHGVMFATGFAASVRASLRERGPAGKTKAIISFAAMVAGMMLGGGAAAYVYRPADWRLALLWESALMVVGMVLGHGLVQRVHDLAMAAGTLWRASGTGTERDPASAAQCELPGCPKIPR